jgi:hypothetical protein
MAKTWVLDTETKGTGAHVVPLADAREKRPAPKVDVPRMPRPRPQPAPEPRRPPRFKVVDVMTRATLAEGIDGRALVDLLKGVRSQVDVHISRWVDDRGDWRLLSLGEQRAIWELRDR